MRAWGSVVVKALRY